MAVGGALHNSGAKPNNGYWFSLKFAVSFTPGLSPVLEQTNSSAKKVAFVTGLKPGVNERENLN